MFRFLLSYLDTASSNAFNNRFSSLCLGYNSDRAFAKRSNEGRDLVDPEQALKAFVLRWPGEASQHGLAPKGRPVRNCSSSLV
jgi:hypothetical protein